MKVNDKKLNEYIKKIMPPTCPLCNNNQWTVGDTIFQLLEYNEEGIVLGGKVWPVLPIVCENCGNTYFVNAIAAGLVEPSTNPNKDGK